MSGPAPARRAAHRALLRLRAGHARLDDSGAALSELEGLDERDRRLATELVLGTVKRRLALDAVLAAFVRSSLHRLEPAVLEALRLGAFQLLYLDRVPAHAAVDDSVALVAAHGRRTRGFVNATLRAVARDGRGRLSELAAGDDPRSRAVRWSCPEWLVGILMRDLGEEAAVAFLEAANAPPERCLRVNPLRGDVAGTRAALAAEGYTTWDVDEVPGALLYDGPPLERSQAFTRGLVTAQSRASQVAGLVAAPADAAGGPLLDLCAAPGTKTAQLAAAHPGARVVAVERDGQRLAALRANLSRLGAGTVETLRGDATKLPTAFDGAFAAVLLDAPCSGLGTLGTRPDVRWRRRPADIAALAVRQRALLAAAARCTRPGGTLTYAVCTVTREETLAVVTTLLRTPGWRADDLGAVWPRAAHPRHGAYLLALPPCWGSTAFFVARLRREGSVAP